MTNNATPTVSLTLQEAMRLHEIEGNPFDRTDIDMYEMFEREGWSPEQRRSFIIAEAKRKLAAPVYG